MLESMSFLIQSKESEKDTSKHSNENKNASSSRKCVALHWKENQENEVASYLRNYKNLRIKYGISSK